MTQDAFSRNDALNANRELILVLLPDFNQASYYAIVELDKACLQLVDRRRSISSEDPEEYQFQYDHYSSIIDNIVGAALVVCQAEIARITSLCSGYSHLDPRGIRDLVRRAGTYSAIETVYQLANLFKHWDDLFGASINGSIKPHQRHTIEVVKGVGVAELDIAHCPGVLERAVIANGDAPELQLSLLSNTLEEWRSEIERAVRHTSKEG